MGLRADDRWASIAEARTEPAMAAAPKLVALKTSEPEPSVAAEPWVAGRVQRGARGRPQPPEHPAPARRVEQQGAAGPVVRVAATRVVTGATLYPRTAARTAVAELLAWLPERCQLQPKSARLAVAAEMELPPVQRRAAQAALPVPRHAARQVALRVVLRTASRAGEPAVSRREAARQKAAG